MVLKAYMSFEDFDDTNYWNYRLKSRSNPGIFAGGWVSPVAGQLKVEVGGDFAAVSYDGMVVRDEGLVSTQLAVSDGYTWWIVCYAKYLVPTPILQYMALLDADYQAHPDKDYLVVLARLDIPAAAVQVSLADIIYSVRTQVDPIARLSYRGYVDLAINLPTPVPNTNIHNDIYLVETEESLYRWDASLPIPAWVGLFGVGGGGGLTLQTAYDGGGTVLTDGARDIIFDMTLGNSFLIEENIQKHKFEVYTPAGYMDLIAKFRFLNFSNEDGYQYATENNTSANTGDFQFTSGSTGAHDAGDFRFTTGDCGPGGGAGDFDIDLGRGSIGSEHGRFFVESGSVEYLSAGTNRGVDFFGGEVRYNNKQFTFDTVADSAIEFVMPGTGDLFGSSGALRYVPGTGVEYHTGVVWVSLLDSGSGFGSGLQGAYNQGNTIQMSGNDVLFYPDSAAATRFSVQDGTGTTYFRVLGSATGEVDQVRTSSASGQYYHTKSIDSVAMLGSGMLSFRTGDAPKTFVGTSGRIAFQTGYTNISNSGDFTVATGGADSGSTGSVDFETGASDTGSSGGFDFNTGNVSGGILNSGSMNFTTGNAADGQSGGFNFVTGNCEVAGDFTVTTGSAASATGTSGSIILSIGSSNTDGSFFVRTGGSDVLQIQQNEGIVIRDDLSAWSSIQFVRSTGPNVYRFVLPDTTDARGTLGALRFNSVSNKPEIYDGAWVELGTGGGGGGGSLQAAYTIGNTIACTAAKSVEINTEAGASFIVGTTTTGDFFDLNGKVAGLDLDAEMQTLRFQTKSDSTQAIRMYSSDSAIANTGGFNLLTGDVTAGGFDSGGYSIRTGDVTTTGDSGSITLRVGEAVDGTAGDIVFHLGDMSGAGNFGNIILRDHNTNDMLVAGDGLISVDAHLRMNRVNDVEFVLPNTTTGVTVGAMKYTGANVEVWTGAAWVVVGGAAAPTLQSAYDGTLGHPQISTSIAGGNLDVDLSPGLGDFIVEDGTDNFTLTHLGVNQLGLSTTLSTIGLLSSGTATFGTLSSLVATTGMVVVRSGNTAGGNSGTLTVTTGDTTGGDVGLLAIYGGDSTVGGEGGSIRIKPGAGPAADGELSLRDANNIKRLNIEDTVVSTRDTATTVFRLPNTSGIGYAGALRVTAADAVEVWNTGLVSWVSVGGGGGGGDLQDAYDAGAAPHILTNGTGGNLDFKLDTDGRRFRVESSDGADYFNIQQTSGELNISLSANDFNVTCDDDFNVQATDNATLFTGGYYDINIGEEFEMTTGAGGWMILDIDDYIEIRSQNSILDFYSDTDAIRFNSKGFQTLDIDGEYASFRNNTAHKLVLPSTSTGGVPLTGSLRYETSEHRVQVYEDNDWQPAGQFHEGQIHGFRIKYVDADTISIGVGSLRDPDDQTSRVVSVATTINFNTVGSGGIQSNPRTMGIYHIALMVPSSAAMALRFIAVRHNEVLSSVPFYSINNAIYIGSIAAVNVGETNSDIEEFVCIGNGGGSREMFYTMSMTSTGSFAAVLAAGSALAWAAIDMSLYVPDQASKVKLYSSSSFVYAGKTGFVSAASMVRRSWTSSIGFQTHLLAAANPYVTYETSIWPFDRSDVTEFDIDLDGDASTDLEYQWLVAATAGGDPPDPSFSMWVKSFTFEVGPWYTAVQR